MPTIIRRHQTLIKPDSNLPFAQNKDDRLSLEEFMQGTQDPLIIKALYMSNLN